MWIDSARDSWKWRIILCFMTRRGRRDEAWEFPKMKAEWVKNFWLCFGYRRDIRSAKLLVLRMKMQIVIDFDPSRERCARTSFMRIIYAIFHTVTFINNHNEEFSNNAWMIMPIYLDKYLRLHSFSNFYRSKLHEVLLSVRGNIVPPNWFNDDNDAWM
jgi:hypothetical protein